jgi:hypothetical protein
VKKLLLILVLAAVVAAVGYLFWTTGNLDGLLSSTVKSVKDGAEQYPDGAAATVHGRVADQRPVPFSDKIFYRVDDGTAGIWVRAYGEPPAKGARVLVRGEVRRGTAKAAGVQLEGTVLDQKRLWIR